MKPVPGETMQRDSRSGSRSSGSYDPYSPFLFDELGYTRLTPLSPNHCPIKTLKGILCARQLAVCCLDKILPRVSKLTMACDGGVVQSVVESWEAAKEIDGMVSGFTFGYIEPMARGGQVLDVLAKYLLLIPCFEGPPAAFLYEGQKSPVIKPPDMTDPMAMIRGPRLDTTEMMLIKDDRTCTEKAFGCGKGKWTIYKDNQVIAFIDYQKNCCGKKLFYRMKDADGVALAKLRMTPTCFECLDQTCRKCTCQCCCLCKICDCLRCKCMFKKPAAKILAPKKKSMIKVFIGGKCCQKPKFPIIFPTLYVPGQEGADDDEEDGKDELEEDPNDKDLDPDVEDEMNEMESDDKDAWKKYDKMGPRAFDKKKNISLAGEEGKPVSIYLKNPPYCCLGFKRDVSKLFCNGFTELLPMDELEEAGLNAENLEGFASAAGTAAGMAANEDAAAALQGLSNAATAASEAAAAVDGATETAQAAAANAAGLGGLAGGDGDGDGSSAAIPSEAEEAAGAAAEGAGAAAQGAKEQIGGVKGKTGDAGPRKRIPTKDMMKDYKRVSAESLDTQFGDNFTTAQRAGILLYWMHTLRSEQE